MITLKIKNQEEMTFSSGTTILELAKKAQKEDVVGGILNGKVHDLNYPLCKNGSFEWIYRKSAIGALMLERTLSFILIVAVKECFPNAQVHIQHTLASGLYGTIEKTSPLTEADITIIRKKMEQIIANQTPIVRRVVRKEEAADHFEKLGMHDKAELLRQRTSLKSSIYRCMGYDDYFYGVMAIHAGMIDHFTLLFYQQGFWLSRKPVFIDQPKLFSVFQRFERLGQENGISFAWQLNQKIKEGRLTEIIQINEQRIQHDLDALTEQIIRQKELKVILIAGPSSAGKTTFSRRLAQCLKKAGHQPLTLSMDDFFKNRVESPRLPDGSYDYENIECLELDLFNHTVLSLLSGKATVLPVYSFQEGIKTWPNPPVSLHENEILIIEGIHALNPRSSSIIEDSFKIKIYINALTHLNYDTHNRIPTSDYRLIRRMTRDFQFRGRSVSETIESWPKVRDGEDRYIYPYQEEADALFNTSMDYELPVLKHVLMPLLDQISLDDPQYIEANRIRKLLAYFVEGEPDLVPEDSILKEFIGGSIFSE